MPFFSDEALADLERERRGVSAREAALREAYLRKVWRQERAREFAQHGFARRLSTLARCIENVFDLIPPYQIDPVDREVRRDAEINIQASVFNVFAAADNLAWIWVTERNVRRPDGSELPDTHVGLRNANRTVRESLPQALREYVAGFDEWFDAVDNYRHALAHRIPLYIPPFVVLEANADRYRELEEEKIQALLAGNLEDHRRLEAEQRDFERFQPVMQHSFGERARPLVFHPQLLANFNTVEEMGRRFLEELGE